jgi:hypothetical protein
MSPIGVPRSGWLVDQSHPGVGVDLLLTVFMHSKKFGAAEVKKRH